MTRGKIVLVPFPYDNFSRFKYRPALCLTEEIVPHQQIIVAYITGNLKVPLLETDLIVDNDSYGLEKVSKIQLHKLMTVSKNRIQKEIGSLSPELMSSVRVKLECLFH